MPIKSAKTKIQSFLLLLIGLHVAPQCEMHLLQCVQQHIKLPRTFRVCVMPQQFTKSLYHEKCSHSFGLIVDYLRCLEVSKNLPNNKTAIKISVGTVGGKTFSRPFNQSPGVKALIYFFILPFCCQFIIVCCQ